LLIGIQKIQRRIYWYWGETVMARI